MAVDDTTRKKIWEHYQKGQGSLQDLARIYKVSVPEVLEIIGHSELASVQAPGDMIDATEAGPGAEMNYGREIHIPFSVD